MDGKLRLYFTDRDSFIRCLIIGIRRRIPHRIGVVDGDGLALRGLVYHNGKKSFRVGFMGMGIAKPNITNGFLITLVESGLLTDAGLINARAKPNVAVLNVCNHETSGRCFDISLAENEETVEAVVRAVLQFYGEDVPIPANSTHGRFATAHQELRNFGRGFMDTMQPILDNKIIVWGVIAFAFIVFALLCANAMGVLWL